MALHRFVEDIVVADGGLQEGIPVDEALAAVDEALAEQIEERLPHGSRAAFIEREPRSLPVAGAAHLLELIENPLLVHFLPFPNALDQSFAAQLVAREAFFLAQPLFWLLSKIYEYVGNWGWAIVIVTFLIKLVFYKLAETSGRSMAKMKTVAPRLKGVQERYKDDREAQARAMMELYKREKINPVAGCLPMLVQIPFFLAFYWVLLESVEMRQAPFMGWIQDLSSRDPYFILPVLMGGAMFLQFKLNPAPPDPVQAKVFAFMPVVMTFMFMWFPAGLVLYWLTNTVLSIAQQWKINRVVEAEAKKQRAG